MPLNKPIDDITEDDLQGLVADAVDERKVMDYKAGWDLAAPGWKGEFRKDVTSFANASGGHIIYGMREKNGVPQEVCGLDVTSPEEARLRLSEILQAHIRPRIPGVEIAIVSALQNSKAAVVVRIPRSFAKPHQVHISGTKDDYQFWARNAGGKYRLDVDELRVAFTLSESLGERVRNFRLDRLGDLIAGETPVVMKEGAKVILHLVPLSAFDPASHYDVSRTTGPLNAWYRWGTNYRFNFEGYLAHMDNPATRCIQVMRNGIVEVVSTDFINSERRQVIEFKLERELLDALPELLGVQRQLGVEPPILVMLSLTGIRGFWLAMPPGLNNIHVITKDILPISPETIETYDIDPAQALVPIFDTIWNAAGRKNSAYFQEGKWVGL